FGDVFEAAAHVAIDDFPLLVARLGAQLTHFGIDVPVGEEDVWPALGVEISESGAPAEPARVEPKAAVERAVLAEAVSHVGVERGGVARKVRLEDVHRAVAVEIADG